jgi:hypothetical protein
VQIQNVGYVLEDVTAKKVIAVARNGKSDKLVVLKTHQPKQLANLAPKLRNVIALPGLRYVIAGFANVPTILRKHIAASGLSATNVTSIEAAAQKSGNYGNVNPKPAATPVKSIPKTLPSSTPGPSGSPTPPPPAKISLPSGLTPTTKPN